MQQEAVHVTPDIVGRIDTPVTGEVADPHRGMMGHLSFWIKYIIITFPLGSLEFTRLTP
jgi:hypothetical protein